MIIGILIGLVICLLWRISRLKDDIIKSTARIKYLEDWLESEFCFSCEEDKPFEDDLELEDTTKI